MDISAGSMNLATGGSLFQDMGWSYRTVEVVQIGGLGAEQAAGNCPVV